MLYKNKQKNKYSGTEQVENYNKRVTEFETQNTERAESGEKNSVFKEVKNGLSERV